MFQEDSFCKNAHGIAIIMQESMLSVKFLQRKPQIKMNF